MSNAPEGLDELVTLDEWVSEFLANVEDGTVVRLPSGVSRIIVDALGEDDPEARHDSIMESRAAYGRVQEWH
jgi:hypothetical protein